MSLNIIYTRNFISPYGELILGSYQDKLCLCDWYHRKKRNEIDKRIQKSLNAKYCTGDSDIIQSVIDQLEEYFSREKQSFELPLHFAGSEFQIRVWTNLLNIPYGETETYLGLSKTLGDEKAIRAIASANGANAISIIVPCHRIIGSNGDLVGYAGGIPVKKKLLELEGAFPDSNQLDLFD